MGFDMRTALHLGAMEFIGAGDGSFENSGDSLKLPSRSQSVKSLVTATGFGHHLRRRPVLFTGSERNVARMPSSDPTDPMTVTTTISQRTTDQQLEAFTKEMQIKEETIHQLEEQIQLKCQEVEQLKGKLHIQKKEIKSLYNESQERESTFERYIDEMKKQFEDHLRVVQSTHDEEIEKLNKKQQKLEALNEAVKLELIESRKEQTRVLKDNEAKVLEVEELRLAMANMAHLKQEERNNELLSENASLKKELEHLKKECSETKMKIVNLQSKIEYQEITSERVRAEFTNQIDSLNELNRTLQQKLRELQADNDELDSTHDPVQLTQTFQNSLFFELKDVKTEELQRQLDSERETVATLKNYIENLLERILQHDPGCLEV